MKSLRTSLALRVEAFRSLRWNYRWRGVWAWLRSPYTGKQYSGNWRRILRDPEAVLMEQDQLASGAFI